MKGSFILSLYTKLNSLSSWFAAESTSDIIFRQSQKRRNSRARENYVLAFMKPFLRASLTLRKGPCYTCWRLQSCAKDWVWVDGWVGWLLTMSYVDTCAYLR